MRILLDESLPRRLRRSFAGHEVVTVVEAGWSGVENGELLRLAATRFDVFVTADQNLQFQQNLSALPLTVAVLVAPNASCNPCSLPLRSFLPGLSRFRLAVSSGAPANHAFNRTRRYGRRSWRASVAAGRLTWSC